MPENNVLNSNFYMSRYGFTDRLISESPSVNLNIVVVIPCYKESDLKSSLQSLLDCALPKCDVEVIVVINASELESEEVKALNLITYHETIEFMQEWNSSRITGYVLLHHDLPKKHAGVGLARKIGMDEAVRRFEFLEKPRGIIVCYDADSSCDANYLVELEKHFKENCLTNACSIHFEHPLVGERYSSRIYDAITDYELHLRYYIQIQKWCGFDHAFQTIGSSMAVRSDIYQKQGGMNKRKAGEDFYFLHKVIPLGDFSELKTTKTIPSPRQSDRVPFGTGRAVNEILEANDDDYLTYAPETFISLKPFFDSIDHLFENETVANDCEELVYSFLRTQGFDQNLLEIRKQSKTIETFRNRFFRWFNGFMLMKFAHYSRDHFYVNIPVEEAVGKLLSLQNEQQIPSTKKEMLLLLRSIDLR